MKLPRRQFLHLAAGAAAPGRCAHRQGANLSDAAGAHHRRRFRWRWCRLNRARDGFNGCRSGLASHSSSRTGRAAAAILAPRRWCGHPRMAIRSSWSMR
jgi:hypothetical protein